MTFMQLSIVVLHIPQRNQKQLKRLRAKQPGETDQSKA